MVLAIAVAVVEDALCAVRHKPARADVHADVANVAADPLVQRAHLVARGGLAGGQLGGQTGDGFGGLCLRSCSGLVGQPEFTPALEAADQHVRCKVGQREPAGFGRVSGVLFEGVFMPHRARRV